MVPSSAITDTQASSCATNCSNLYSSVPNAEFWCAAESDSEPWLLLDLGHLYHVTGIDIRLPLGNQTFDTIAIEGSSDGKSWLSYGYTELTNEVTSVELVCCKCIDKNFATC